MRPGRAHRGVRDEVPLYTTQSANQVRHLLRDSGATVLFVAGSKQSTAAAARHGCPTLRHVVVIDQADNVAPGQPASPATGDLTLSELEEIGAGSGAAVEVDARLARLTRSDLASVIYTAGPEGAPLGAMITHGNVLSQIDAFDDRFTLLAGDRSLCFLPLAHAYERVWTYVVLSHGVEHVYVDDPRESARMIRTVRPHAFVSTPRLYEKIHATVQAEVCRRWGPDVYEWAVRSPPSAAGTVGRPPARPVAGGAPGACRHRGSEPGP